MTELTYEQREKENWKGLDAIEKNIKIRFPVNSSTLCGIHDIAIYPQNHHTKRNLPPIDGYDEIPFTLDIGSLYFRVYLFFKKDDDIIICDKNGETDSIKKAVYEQLKSAGKEENGQLEVVYEIDSDENVQANYEGSYFNRLR